MKNAKFNWLLKERRDARGKRLWTIAKVADAIYTNRAHVTDVLNNKPQHGAQTRPKLVKFFKKEFPDTWPQIIDALGWTDTGNLLADCCTSDIPHGTRQSLEPVK
jgi:hypothetical protein